MNRAALVAFAFVGLAGCDASPSAPPPGEPSIGRPLFAQVINDKPFVMGTLFNPCPPEELVAFEGFIHQHATGDITPPDFDVKSHINTQGVEGVGLISGDRYSIQQNSVNEFFASGPVLDQTRDIRFRMVRQGSRDNLWMRNTVRFTAPPFTVEIIRQEIECRGPTGEPI